MAFPPESALSVAVTGQRPAHRHSATGSEALPSRLDLGEPSIRTLVVTVVSQEACSLASSGSKSHTDVRIFGFQTDPGNRTLARPLSD